jgi:aminopeptidase N
LVSRWIGARWIAGALLLGAAAAGAQMPAHGFGDSHRWQWTPSRSYHVVNYKLTLHFDQARDEVFGDETVTLRPFAQGFRRIDLDSAELTIDSVELLPKQAAPTSLRHERGERGLRILLDRDYGASDLLNVRIVYHGFPRTGLFFVNPTKDYPDWPREIYSQGEPEFNHYWFPCWDSPNDMATSETITTVPEGQVVISNGKLAGETHSGGQATYDWVESIPHSSYLISIAVGPFRKVTDQYRNTPVDYYVPRSVDEATARRSFHLTPDMIGFFSRATGVEYPYEQYAQTTVQNYIFGGQENVSATTLTDSTLHDERADADYPSTDLVSHELGQHWFGDYVQGRDWAEIWLNEGFATYLEALYTQHHEGYDAYRLAIYNDQQREQAEGRDHYTRPIVDRHFTDPLQMFDATTHEKGAAVLDMLRYVVDGPEAMRHPASQAEPFFRALNDYLVSHRAQDADTDELIAAIRQTTGMELDRFFREWVYMAGHLAYRVTARYDDAAKVERLTVEQTQKIDAETPLFDMPIELAFCGKNGERKQVRVRDDEQKQEFEIPLEFEPQWVDFDPEDIVDKTVEFEEPLDALIAQAERDPSMMSRLWAAQQLGERKAGDADASTGALAHVLETDAFYAVRAAAAASLGKIGTDRAKDALLAAIEQPDSRVRRAVVEALGHFAGDARVFTVLTNALNSDASYAVQAAAAEQIGRSRDSKALEILQSKIANKPEIHVVQAALAGIAASGDARAAAILIAHSQPGVPERIRLSALGGLARVSETARRDHAKEIAGAVGAALRDSYLPVRETAEELAGAFGLVEYRDEIRRLAQDAAMTDERETAQQALSKLESGAGS